MERRKVYILAGAAVGLALIALLCVLLFGSCESDKYGQYYSDAESAVRAHNYDEAIELLEKAIAERPEAEAYLLLSECYERQGELDMAIQILSLGYSKTGDTELSERIETLRAQQGEGESGESGEMVEIGSKRVAIDTTSLAVNDEGLTDDDIASIGQLRSLEHLSLTGNKLRNLTVLQTLSSLTDLQLSDNQISDLTPLSRLTHLKTLYLDDNPITDLSPLYSLTSLHTLSVKNISADAQALRDLKKNLPDCHIYADEAIADVEDITLGSTTFRSDATEIDISGQTSVSDLSPLSACTQLRKLYASGCNISDLSPLVDLPQLQVLDVSSNALSDLRPLMSVTGLVTLNISKNSVSDLTVLRYLTRLEELDVSGNPLSSYGDITTCTTLQRLTMQNLHLQDTVLTSLTALKNLQSLDLRNNSDLTRGAVDTLEKALPNCTVRSDENLKKSVRFGDRIYMSDATNIDLSDTALTSLDGLEIFTQLERLDISHNTISSLSALADLRYLRTLYATHNTLTSLSGLESHQYLQELDVNSNSIESLDGLSGCTELEILSLANNHISSISALAAMTKLTELDLSNNSLTDVTALAGLTQLKSLDLRGNRALTAEQLQTLAAALPNAAILADVSVTPTPSPTPTPTPTARPSTSTDIPQVVVPTVPVTTPVVVPTISPITVPTVPPITLPEETEMPDYPDYPDYPDPYGPDFPPFGFDADEETQEGEIITGYGYDDGYNNYNY